MGDLARIEDPPGRLSLIAGATCFWRSWPVDDGVVRLPREDDARFDHDLSLFWMVDPVKYWDEWLGDPELVARTLRAVEREGRASWRFTAPRLEGGTPEITVDADLGLVVEASRRDRGVFQEWTGLRTDPSLEPSYFSHAG